jgi:NAD(P)-dependent dehydrogenase (short-subunit alcohol dehydrogenase family)
MLPIHFVASKDAAGRLFICTIVFFLSNSSQFRVFACARGASRAGADARFSDLLAAGSGRQASLLEMIDLDVGDSASIVAATAQIGAKTNSVDLLINNAGVRCVQGFGMIRLNFRKYLLTI